MVTCLICANSQAIYVVLSFKLTTVVLCFVVSKFWCLPKASVSNVLSSAPAKHTSLPDEAVSWRLSADHRHCGVLHLEPQASLMSSNNVDVSGPHYEHLLKIEVACQLTAVSVRSIEIKYASDVAIEFCKPIAVWRMVSWSWAWPSMGEHLRCLHLLLRF